MFSSQEQIIIPDIPDQVDLKDLDWRQDPPRLLNREQREQVELLHEEGTLPSNQRISKRDLRNHLGLETLRNSVSFISSPDEKAGEHCMAWYKGKHHGKHLGEGEFGKAKLVQDQVTGTWYVGKVQLSNSAATHDEKLQEANAAKMLQAGSTESKNTELVGFFSQGYSQNSHSRGTPGYHQIMDLALGKTLYDWMQTEVFYLFHDKIYLEMIIQYMTALQDMHDKNIYHQDFHARNIMYSVRDGEVTATPIDFGRSVYVDQNDQLKIDFYTRQDIRKIQKAMTMLTREYPLAHTLTKTADFFYRKFYTENSTARAKWQAWQHAHLNNIGDLENNELIKCLAEYANTLARQDERNFTDILFPLIRQINQSGFDDEALQMIMTEPALRAVYCQVMNITPPDEQRIFLIRDERINGEVQNILSSLKNTTLSEAIDSLRTLRDQLPDPEITSREINVQEWSLMQEEEKINFLSHVSPLDRIALVAHTPLESKEEDANDRTDLLKLCVIVKRELSKQGFCNVSQELTLRVPSPSDEPEPKRIKRSAS